MDVGLDIDGVLCDHVTGLCERIGQRYGIILRPEMVTEWDLDFGPSSITRAGHCDIVLARWEALTGEQARTDGEL